MPTYTEAQIREAIETEIKLAAPNAVVFPWWNLSGDMDTWPGKLIPETGPDAGKVHGYVLTRGQIGQIGGGEDGRVTLCRVRPAFTYEIVGMHFHDTGNRTANSDLKFNAELDAISERFKDLTNFTGTALARVHMPRFGQVDLKVLGGALRHFALGSLVAEQC
jgi:hypothetical protein